MTLRITRQVDHLALRFPARQATAMSAFLLLICGVAAAADSDGPPRVLFRENFEDTNFASRGWYDSDATVVLSSEQHISGSTKSYEIHFRTGDISPATPRRHLFAESDSVYISFWVKSSPNWMGSGKPYHPHFMHLMTNLNDPFFGPAWTHLTAYVEDIAGTPQMGIQDGQNITANMTGEERAVAGCNGDWDGHGSGECYKAGNEHRNGKAWRAKQQYFRDSPGLYYKGDWHHIEAYFRLNTISVPGRSNKDGVIQYWYDGTALIDVEDAVLRTAEYPGMKFNQFLLAPHIGNGSPIDQSLWVEDLLVATGKPAARVSLGGADSQSAEPRLLSALVPAWPGTAQTAMRQPDRNRVDTRLGSLRSHATRFAPPPPCIRLSPARRVEKCRISL